MWIYKRFMKFKVVIVYICYKTFGSTLADKYSR